MQTMLPFTLGQTLRNLPGVVASWLSSAAALHGRCAGWLACPECAQPTLIAQLKRDFGPGVYDRNFFFGHLGDATMSLLVFDPARPGTLAPGFSAIPFLDDGAEALLVELCSAEIEACATGAFHAARLVESRFDLAASDQIALTTKRLKHVLACMFWRDLDVPREMLPSGPWRALQVALDGISEALPDRVRQLFGLIHAARRLLIAQHAPTQQMDSQEEAVLPSWYEDTQAESYDRHRAFPACIGPCVAAVLNAMPLRCVTEVGVGTGRFSLAVLEAGARQDFALLDNSAAMLDRLRSKLSASLQSRVSVGHGTLDGLGSAPSAVGALLEHEVFFLHANPYRLARNIATALRPDGVLIRLERSTRAQPSGADPTVAFDLRLAGGLGSPIGLVGEGCAQAVDQALSDLGFETIRRTLTRYSRIVTNDALHSARRSRTYPYLAYVSEPVLNEALDCFVAPSDTRPIRLLERYDLAISVRSDAIRSGQLAATLRALPEEMPD